MNILISAYACEPCTGSEPGVGWTWARAAAQHHHVWALTRCNNLPAIQAWELAHGATDIHWVGFDGPKWRRSLKRKLPKGDHWYYAWWQRAIVPTVADLQRQVGFDLFHHVTFVTHQYPCYLMDLGVPVIFGPVAGADIIPMPLRGGLSWSERWSERLRDLLLARAGRNPDIVAGLRKAACVFAASPANKAYCRATFGVDPRVKPAMTVDIPAVAPLVRAPGGLRLVSAGLLIGWKGHWLTLRALARMPPDVTLDLIGHGPDEARLRRLAQDLGVANRVRWHPWMAQADLHARIRASDVFMAPSLRDSGGMAVLEALRCGCPVVAVALGGAMLSIRDGINGFLVPPGDQDAVVAALADRAQAAALLTRTAISATTDAFTPDALAPWLADLYAGVCAGHRDS